LEYTNPEIPEGINTSKTHPLKEFIWLTGGVVSVIAVLMIVLILIADFLTPYIPFRFEQKLAHSVIEQDTETGPLPDYLQSLTQRIVLAEDLPDGMSINVHYLDDDTVNAFATLGGHVYLFRGLLEKLPNENALAMVLAHEIAHIKHRHPIRSLNRGVLIALAMTVISSSAGDSMSEGFLGEAGFLTLMKYSRDMETEADQTAITALLSHYGHLAGADDLFKILRKENGSMELPAFFSTHPLARKRSKNMKKYLTQGTNTITPLPQDFKKWLEQ
jgi:predicted Zn-dependent protease